MKTSGIKIGILPILGEVTCLFFFPSKRFFPSFFRVFPSSSWLHFCSFLRNHQSTTDHPQLLVPAPSVSLLRSSRSSSSSSNRSSCKHRQAEAAVGESTELHSSGRFQATSGDDLVA